jgi:ketosteroid isomerase-like protein
MRTLVLALALVLALVACASSPSHEATSPQARRFEPADRAAITTLLDQQIAAWNRGDLMRYMDAYARTPALIFTSGGNIRRGWQDAFDHYQARYATDPRAMGTLVFRIDSIDPVGADGAVVLGHWDLTGSEHPGRGVFTLVLERRPEGWRIIHDHTSIST